MDDKLVRKTYEASETKFLDDSRSLLVKISTGTPDRSKDVVVPDGVNLTNYLKNPVVALAHKYDGLAIAKTEEIKVVDNGIVAKVTFPDKEIYPLADTVYELYKGGFMNAWSIGFMPLEVEDIEGGGREFKKWELLEYSAVLVPDNPEALTLLRSKGFKTEEIEKLIADKVEDKGVIPFKDTPTADAGTAWDGPAEVREADVEDLKLMATWVDSDNPDIKTSYKLPHHRASDHWTVLRGVQAAMGALLGARGGVDIPDADRRGVYNHLARHYAQYDAEPPEFRSYTEAEFKELFPDEKERLVIRGKNRKLVSGAVEILEQVIVSFKELLEAKEPEDGDDSGEDQKLAIGLVSALRLSDQVVGVALRDYKVKLRELGIVPDDSLQPEGVKDGKGGDK